MADSLDNGVTWTQAHYLDLPNNNSGIDVIKLKDGRIVMIYNDTSDGRSPLNLAISKDGEHFRMFRTLEKYRRPSTLIQPSSKAPTAALRSLTPGSAKPSNTSTSRSVMCQGK